MTPKRFLPALLFTIISAAALLPAASAANWPPIDPSEFADTHGRVDPNADSEDIRREVVEDGPEWRFRKWEVYVKRRIYNEMGVQRASVIDIYYGEIISIGKISVRTTKPNGTSVQTDDVEAYDREVFKEGGERVRARSFSPPGLESGAIVEYRYTAFLDPGVVLHSATFQSDVPARSCSYRVRPLHIRGMQWRVQFFNLPEKEIKQDKDAFLVFEYENLKAVKPEPFSPPPIHTQASIIINYVENTETSVPRYWSGRGKELQREENRVVKPTPRVKALAASLASASDPPMAKIAKFFDHCRTVVTNYDNAKNFLTAEERKKLPKESSPDETVENGKGKPADINKLFAALAATTGLETKLALVNDRSVKIVRPDSADPDSVGHLAVAVKIDGKWVFFDPGEIFVPFGMLSWRHTDTVGMLASKSGGVLETFEGTRAEESVRTRTGKLKLDEEGKLEGTVDVTYTGLWEAAMRERMFTLSESERRDRVRHEVRESLPGAEVSEIKVEGVDDLLQPVRVSYQLSAQGYAERTGSRLFVQPAVFQRGLAPMFVDATRIYDIIFEFRHKDIDDVEIALPDGFILEAHSAPPVPGLAPLARYETMLGLKKSSNSLLFKRTFYLDSVAVLARYYDPIKLAFEGVHRRDNHAVSLKRADYPVALSEKSTDAN